MILLTKKGFTLIELVVSIGVFTVVTFMAYSGLLQLLSANKHIEKEQDFWQKLATTYTIITDDLTYARARPVYNYLTNDTSPSFIVRENFNNNYDDKPFLEFTRAGLINWDKDNEVNLELQRVGYLYQDKNLYRLIYELDIDKKINAFKRLLLSNVEDITINCLRKIKSSGGIEKKCSKFKKTDDQYSQESLPLGIELVLSITGRGEFKKILMVSR